MTGREIIKRLFVVRKCGACHRILGIHEFERALCPECEADYRTATTETCNICMRSAIECDCQPRMLSEGGSLCLRKLYFYHIGHENDPQNRMIYFLKHKPARRMEEYIARDLWSEISAELLKLGIDNNASEVLFTNVPRGRKGRTLYGFDQSQRMCESLNRISGIPYARLILRKMGGNEQKKLNAAQRRANIKKLMRPNEKEAHMAKGRYVILFDDVVTTGASMAACLPILRKMGVRDVICVSIAYDAKK